MVEETNQASWIKGSFIPLEFIMIYGWGMMVNWNRYFFNEKQYLNHEEFLKHIVETKVVRRVKFDLSKSTDRDRFEKNVNKYNRDFPGMLCPDGEDFDFYSFYKWYDQMEVENKLNELNDEDMTQIAQTIKNQKEMTFVPKAEEDELPKPSSKKYNVQFSQEPSYMERDERVL